MKKHVWLTILALVMMIVLGQRLFLPMVKGRSAFRPWFCAKI